MDAARRERAALDAIHAEAAALGGYRWGERDCSTMIASLCAAMGLPVPAYGPYQAMSEGRAAVLCLRRYGSLGASHRAGLLETGRWAPAEPPMEAGDVVSLTAALHVPYGPSLVPVREGMDFTGIVSGGKWWTWGAHGLEGVALYHLPAEALVVTRAA